MASRIPPIQDVIQPAQKAARQGGQSHHGRPFASHLDWHEAELTGNTLVRVDNTGEPITFTGGTPAPTEGGHYPYMHADGVTGLMHSGMIVDIRT